MLQTGDVIVEREANCSKSGVAPNFNKKGKKMEKKQDVSKRKKESIQHFNKAAGMHGRQIRRRHERKAKHGTALIWGGPSKGERNKRRDAIQNQSRWADLKRREHEHLRKTIFWVKVKKGDKIKKHK